MLDIERVDMYYMILTILGFQLWFCVWIVCEIIKIKNDIKIIILNSHRDRNIIVDAIKEK